MAVNGIRYQSVLGAVDLCCTLLQQSVYHLDKATVCRSSGLNQKQSTQYKRYTGAARRGRHESILLIVTAL